MLRDKPGRKHYMRTGAPGKNPAQKVQTSSKRTGTPKKKEKQVVHYTIFQYEKKGLSKNKTQRNRCKFTVCTSDTQNASGNIYYRLIA